MVMIVPDLADVKRMPLIALDELIADIRAVIIRRGTDRGKASRIRHVGVEGGWCDRRNGMRGGERIGGKVDALPAEPGGSVRADLGADVIGCVRTQAA
jgi:hypothetical protein